MSRMLISSFSVNTGGGCNIKCPFCVSRMSYRVNQPPKKMVNPQRLAFLADKFMDVSSGIPYGIITGKGEPTLAPREWLGEIIEVMRNVRGPGLGLVPELQTNGTLLNADNMGYWSDNGLSTIALSSVSHLDMVNSQMLTGGKLEWSQGRIIKEAKDIGLLIRLTVILTKGGVDSADSFLAFMNWAQAHGVHQVTFRKMGAPRDVTLNRSQKVAQWIQENNVDPNIIIGTLRQRVQAGEATEKKPWPWALRFGYDGMSVVVTDHMNAPKDGKARHAVVQPDGHLYGSWDDPADIII